MADNRELFFDLLKNEILQLDQPDLDFGIYRILNFRRAEIERFFDEELPKVLEEAVADAGELADTELDRLYNHLHTFFSRYYRDGDFEPQPRRAREARYSVPYNGEDVHFYWRSFGSHYVKSAQELRSHSFRSAGHDVRFELSFAFEEPENVKGKTRYFIPQPESAETRSEGGLPVFVVPFAFMRIPTTEETRLRKNDAALEGRTIQERLLSERCEQLAPPGRIAKSHLLQQMRIYTARARRDYFVHPRLGEFLQGELTYFLATEVMDAPSLTSVDGMHQALARTGVLRAVATEIIDLLAALETIQAALFEKRRFVLDTRYLIRLDMLPRELWPNLLQCPELVAMWADDFGVSVSSEAQLAANPTLVVDTARLPEEVGQRVLAAIDDIGEIEDGLIVGGDNYGALRTLGPSIRAKVDLVYNDPPYNTGSDGFPYKDDFSRHSTWLSMVAERTQLCREVLANEGVLLQSVDENEHIRASLLLDLLFGEYNRVVDIVWKNSSKNDQDFVSAQHEYIIGALKDKTAANGEWTELKEGLDDIYSAFEGFRKEHGDDWEKIHEEALRFYRSLPAGHPARDHKHYNWMDERGVYSPQNIAGPNFGQYRYDVVHPVTGEVCKEPTSGWRFPEETMNRKILDGLIHFGKDHTTVPNTKTYLKETESQGLTSVKYRDGRIGSRILENVLGYRAFDNPKDPGLLARIFGAIAHDHAVILDAFAGSGSTGHAVIELNRRDRTRRRFVLIELDRHIHTVLIPRIARLMYYPEWSNGKPQLPVAETLIPTHIEHAPRVVRILSFERFEDSLNSLERAESREEETQLELSNPMRYSASELTSPAVLLDTRKFESPFTYSLRTHDENALRETSIDLVETFNVIAGIRVTRLRWGIDGSRHYRLVDGEANGERVLVVWRDAQDLDPSRDLEFLSAELASWAGTELSDFARIWHNADSAIPNGQSLDAEFQRLMFEPEPGMS